MATSNRPAIGTWLADTHRTAGITCRNSSLVFSAAQTAAGGGQSSTWLSTTWGRTKENDAHTGEWFQLFNLQPANTTEPEWHTSHSYDPHLNLEMFAAMCSL